MSDNNKLPDIRQTDIESILKIAIEKGTGIEVMERLLAMRKEIKAEDARDQFAQAMANFQEQCPRIPKKHKVLNSNGTIRYKYAKLDDITEAIQEPMGANGLSYKWETEFVFENNKHFELVTCVVTHVAGHSERSTFKVPIEFSNAMNAIQSFGSAGTYGRRYSLCDALGISADEDDDAAKVITVTPEPPTQKPEPTGDLRMVKVIDQEEGVTARTGKPWTRYDVYFEGDEKKYSTFSDTICQNAGRALATGTPVIIQTKSTADGKFWNLEALTLQGEESKADRLVSKLRQAKPGEIPF